MYLDEEKIFENDLKYCLQENDSEYLLVGFSGYSNHPTKKAIYNYGSTLRKVKINKLFILDDHGYDGRGCWSIGTDGNYELKEMVCRLINLICEQKNIKKDKVIMIGSSKGGFSAIYFGLRVNAGYIIAGAPQVKLAQYLKEKPKVYKSIVGDDENGEEFLNNIILDIVKPNNTQIYITCGKDDYHLSQHIMPFVDKMIEKNNSKNLALDITEGNHGNFWTRYKETLIKVVNEIVSGKYRRNILMGCENVLAENMSLSEMSQYLKPELFSCRNEDNKIITTIKRVNQNLTYACYLIKGNNVLEKRYYQKCSEFEFIVNESGKYTLKWFIKNKDKEIFRYILDTNVIVNNAKTNNKEVNHELKNEIVKENTEKIESNNIEKYKEVLSTIGKNESPLEKANDILNNKFHLNQILDVIPFKDGIDWDYRSSKNQNSYQLYLHALQPISYLVNAYLISNDKKYLIKALEIIVSWNDYDNKSHNNNLVWYDHTVANRTLNLLFFKLAAKNIIEFDELLLDELITKNIEFLLNDDNYRMHNHCIMMDKSLIIASYILNQPILRIKALSRLKENFYCTFSMNGVHLENSTFYHNFVKGIFLDIECFLNKNELSLGPDILKRLNKANNYFKYIAKPDKFLPQIGDSIKISDNKIEKNYNNFIDIDAGIAIIQELNTQKPEDSLWLSFVCGYSTTTHKHLDDLSINLYYKGKDILVDSGGYGYGTSKERLYVRSSLAHSTISVKNKKYKHDIENTKIRITDFTSNSRYHLVRGKNNAYKGIELERIVIVVKPSTVIIVDKAKAEVEEEFLQIFNLSKESKILEVNKERSLINIEELEVSFEQLLSVDKVNEYKGDLKTPRAVIAEKSGQLTKVSQLEYIKRGTEVQMITVLNLDKNNIRKIDYIDNKIVVSDGNEYFDIII